MPVVSTPPLAATLAMLPVESFADLPEDALCVICQQPSLDNVSMCLQGHNACRACANKWVNTDNDNAQKCASCRTPLHRPLTGHVPVSTWVSNTALNNLVKDFQVKCPHVGAGCTHQCKAQNMKAHMEECEWREMKCKCSGCAWKGPACKWHQHMKDEDHGCHLVDMLLFSQQVCATMVDKFDLAEEKHARYQTDVVDPLKLQLSCIASGVNNLTDTCRAIEGHTNKHDGSSARSKRRDRKNQKDVDEAEAEQHKAEQERDELKRKLDEKDSFSAFHSQRYTAMEEDLRNLPSVAEWRRAQESAGDAAEAYEKAQTRIHEQHALLAKMMPHAAPRLCPCDLETCSGGANAHLYKRRRRQTVDEPPTPPAAPPLVVAAPAADLGSRRASPRSPPYEPVSPVYEPVSPSVGELV